MITNVTIRCLRLARSIFVGLCDVVYGSLRTAQDLDDRKWSYAVGADTWARYARSVL